MDEKLLNEIQAHKKVHPIPEAVTFALGYPGLYVQASRWEGKHKNITANILMYVIEGACVITVNKKPYVVTPHQLILLPTGCDYEYRRISGEKISFYSWAFRASLYGYEFADYLELCQKSHVVTIPNHDEMVYIFKSCASEGMTNPYADYFNITAQLSKIIAIFTELQLKEDAFSEEKKKYEAVISYMNEHLDCPFSADTLAHLMYMPISTFNRKFRLLYGMSPIRYYDTMRAQRAVDLIMNTDLSLHKISKAIGIENKYHFADFFKRHTGVSPSEYVEVFRNGD